MPTNETHDPALRSWVESANDPATDFPIQNLPCCAFLAEHDGHRHTHLGVVIGDQILDVSALNEAGYFGPDGEQVVQLLRLPFWDGIASTPGLPGHLRRRLQDFLNADAHLGQQARRLRTKVLRPLKGTPLAAPMRMFNYTDFYASIDHASTVGSMFRPDNPLLPNYRHVPIGYHGRASSIIVSGAEVVRPRGQLPPPDAAPDAPPTFGPTRMLDYELEVGVLIGQASRLGEPVPVATARDHIFGLCLVNDWSARDIQKWEYQPLGPFLSKNFATTVSPLVVMLEALEPFRVPARRRTAGEPTPLPYLLDDADQAEGAIDLTLEVHLRTTRMWETGAAPVLISSSRALKDLYWTIAQLLAHHTSGGCNLLPGDLLATGTVSGSTPEERGCLLERTWQGRGPDGKPLPRRPIELPTGETRLFLEDGDEVIFKAYAQREGFRRIGLGECRGRIAPPKQ